MFDILIYLYETYNRPDACPTSQALVKKLSAVGFDDDDISDAMTWLDELKQTSLGKSGHIESSGFRVYTRQESVLLGMAAIGFIQFLESAKLINSQQREIIIESVLTVDETPISLEKLKIIVLILLWSQGKEPDMLMFDELNLSDEQIKPQFLN